ncbi:MAG: tetratricopeptide repeat protein [Chloroflexi bacterium]|nr:tetratricopeptide repeat protein [Chloroflexota bacterium]MCY4247991.1 tetratricopeptide repeat protein [Chloroflexota bacterium]
MPTKTDSLSYDIRQLMKAGAFHDIVDRCHVELTLARREKRQSIEVIALLGLADAQCSLGHFDFARDYSSQALERADQIPSASLAVDALNLRARVAREGYFQTGEALDDYRRAVDIAFEAGDMRRYAQSLLGMGEIAASPADSSKHAWRVIDIARELNDEQLEARGILLLSNALIRKGDHNKASDGLLVALRKAQSVGDRLLESVIIGQQGLVLAQEAATFERGIEQQLVALDVCRGMEAIFHEFMRLYTLSMTMLAAQDLGEARAYLDQMLALAQDVQHGPYEMYTLGMLGQWQELRGKPDIAISYYGRAIESARAAGNPAYAARYLYALGAAHQSQGEFATARSYYKEAQGIYQALDDGRNATRARATILYSYLLALASRIINLLGLAPKRG